MANGYIGYVHVGNDDYKIGSALFAILDTNKNPAIGSITTNSSSTTFYVPLEGFTPLDGITVHVQFQQANSQDNNTTSGNEHTLYLKVGNSSSVAYPISNPNGAATWSAGSVISFTLVPNGASYKWVINSSQIDTSKIQIDVSQLSNLSLGNITSEGKLGAASSLVVTNNDNKITTGVAFGESANGTFLNNTGAWSTPPDTKYNLIVGASNSATSNAAVNATANSIYLNLLENNSVKTNGSHNIVGTGGVTVASDANGKITINGETGVTSITLTQGDGITISNSGTAITNSGTRTISLADTYGDTKNPYGTKTANYVLAGPATGDAAVPSFRALVTDDIPDTIARLASPTFTGTPLLTTTPSAGDNSHAIADTAFVINEINQRLSSNDAMLFKGTIGAGGTINTTANPAQTLPTTGYQAGWTYRVITAGTYAGQVCEVGDLIIAIHDGPSTGSNVINDDWTIAQTNIDGSIYMGGNSLTSGQLLVADGTNGQITTSGFSIAQPTAGGILYGTTDAYNILSAGSNNYVLTMSGGTPTWAVAQHFLTHLYVTTSSGTTNTSTALENGNVYLRLFDTTTARESHKITGAGGTTVTTDTNANIIITSKKYKTAGTANAFTGLSLIYNNGSDQTTTVNANTTEQIGYVNGGILYIKSIKYSTTEVSTGVSEDT